LTNCWQFWNISNANNIQIFWKNRERRMRNGQLGQTSLPILVVDDDMAQLKTLADILALEELHPICCQTGQEALAASQRNEVNVAVLDLRLPDVDGLQLLKQLKIQNPQIKVIIHTGYASLDTALAAINEEAFAYVRKMGNVEELLAHIHRAFHMHLAKYNELLEREVEKRTQELVQANQELKNEIIERQRLEEQLRQSQKMEAVGRLAGGIAHDFNNLLTVINGYSDLLLQRRTSAHDDCRYELEQIKRAGERAASLTRQLLAFSRQQILQPRILDLNVVVSDIDKMLRRIIGEDIELVIRSQPGLGLVKADLGQMEQVIMNLAINSRDAMPQGGQLAIETANAYLDETYGRQHVDVIPGDYVLLAVSDTGIGMDAETVSHLFEPFFTTKEVGKGTGLGLATVYGIIAQSGGHLWVHSQPEQGTIFKIYLPQINEATIEVLQPSTTEAWLLQGVETILLVEDEASVRDFARGILEANGYTVLPACYGDEALTISQQHPEPIHLLLTDVIIPGGMSGCELAHRLILLRPELKVLYISGYTSDAIIRHGVLDSDTAFLQKPFTPHVLTRKVRKVLDKASV
jgi:signal transduction histidine kinase